MFIVISGPIGVGKSTVTRILSRIIGFTPFFETVEHHPYLEGLYRDPARYALRTQVFFLRDRFQKHMQSCAEGVNVVADRSIYEDQIFAELLCNMGHMGKDDFEQTYLPHFKLLTGLLPAPDLMICLKASLDTLMFRIASRGREMEKSIERSYMQMLQEGYDKWIEEYPHRKLILDTDSIDLTCELNNDWNHMLSTVLQAVDGIKFASNTIQNSKRVTPAMAFKA